MTPMQTPHSATNVVAWCRADLSDFEPSDLDPSDIEFTKHQFSSILRTITAKGGSVHLGEQPEQVLDAVAKQTPDLLLIHLQTSGEQGYQLCQMLRQQALTKHLPIVFVGTRGTSHEWISALRCGGNDYLQMPITSEECWLRLEHHLSTAQLVRQLQATQLDLAEQIKKNNHVLEQHKRLEASLDRENQALQQLAFVDELTQVDNRRSFNQNIARRWEEAREKRQRISLLVCDIDYFKRYNDTYGHLAGDSCLQTVAAALREGVNRQQDQIARYGGEEFVILLPNTDAVGAQKVARGVLAAVARARIAHKSSLIKPYLSLSIGISTLRPAQLSHCTHEELIKRADEALYNAKLQGRDRIFLNTAHPKQLAAEKVSAKKISTEKITTEKVANTWESMIRPAGSLGGNGLRKKVLR